MCQSVLSLDLSKYAIAKVRFDADPCYPHVKTTNNAILTGQGATSPGSATEQTQLINVNGAWLVIFITFNAIFICKLQCWLH